MRFEILLTVLLVAGSPLAGCLEGGEQLEPASSPIGDTPGEGEFTGSEDQDANVSSDDESPRDGDESSRAEGPSSSSTQENGTGTSNGTAPVDEGPTPDEVAGSQAVVAHIDTGINPYHEAFRDDSELARTHPSEYIDGYPEDARALNLTLDADTWQQAFRADEDVWANVTEGQLYWIPGTRIVGAVSFGSGGTFCPLVEAPPANLVGDPSEGGPASRCTEHPILDDFGHGTMTASRMAGEGTSLCPDCRIVSIEGLGAQRTKWAADTGWIDVQTNSWGYRAPDPVFAAAEEAEGGNAAGQIAKAAQQHLVYFSSGNGFAGFFGFTPWPTHVQPTLREDVVWVGAHDNGRVAHWQGTPPHVVADGYRGLAAGPRNLTGVGPTPYACCTSASSPYAAGLGARLVEEARSILGDTSEGPTGGVLAKGAPGATAVGPLQDGNLTVDELRELVKHTAEPRPSEGRHDGAVHWTGDPSLETASSQGQPWGPGGNPYCPGCTTMPVAWTEIPDQAPAYPIVGYGGATPSALDTALRVLQGLSEEPARDEVDQYFETQRPVHEGLHDPFP